MSIAVTNEPIYGGHDELSSRDQTRPLRVCMITYSFYETDNRVMRYAETLARRGDFVEVFALQREDLPAYEVLDGVHLHRIQHREVNEKGRFTYLTRILQFMMRA